MQHLRLNFGDEIATAKPLTGHVPRKRVLTASSDLTSRHMLQVAIVRPFEKARESGLPEP